eukprot:4518166-Karenia_brevis.AAC.1
MNGHRAYVNVDAAAVEAKALTLPKGGVPPEIIRLLPHDNHLDKIMIQKAAAPVDRHTHDLDAVAKNLSCQRPNAVVMEKTSKS